MKKSTLFIRSVFKRVLVKIIDGKVYTVPLLIAAIIGSISTEVMGPLALPDIISHSKPIDSGLGGIVLPPIIDNRSQGGSFTATDSPSGEPK